MGRTRSTSTGALATSALAPPCRRWAALAATWRLRSVRKDPLMPGRRRRALAVEAERRVGELKRRIGGEVVAMRRRRSWTQDRLAERAGINRLVVSRVGRGDVALVLELLQRLAIALVIPLND